MPDEEMRGPERSIAAILYQRHPAGSKGLCDLLLNNRELKIHDERDNDDVYRPREDWNDDVGFGGKMKT